MSKEELYKLALSDVHKYNLLNEIFAIRDTRVEKEDYTIAVNGYISLDVLNQYIQLQEKLDEINKICEYFLTSEKGLCEALSDIQKIIKERSNGKYYIFKRNI